MTWIKYEIAVFTKADIAAEGLSDAAMRLFQDRMTEKEFQATDLFFAVTPGIDRKPRGLG